MSVLLSSPFLEDSDLIMDDEPSLMDTGICPMSVFDKFGFDCNLLGADTDSLLDSLDVPCDPDSYKNDDDLINSTLNPFRNLFPDLIDGGSNAANDLQQSSHSSALSSASGGAKDTDSFSSPASSSCFDNLFASEEKPVVKSEPVVFDVDESSLDALPVPLNDVKIEHDPLAAFREIQAPTVSSTSTTIPVASVATNITMKNPLLTVPIKSSAGIVHPSFTKPGTKRMVKAVVVCPDRSKGIFCNVVPGKLNKGLILRNGRSLLNLTGGKVEGKLPIKVNVIAATKNHPFFALEKVKPKIEPVDAQQKPFITALPSIQTTASSGAAAVIPNECRIKIEFDDTMPDTPPQSLAGSDGGDNFHPFSSPIKCDVFADSYMKTGLLDEDNLCGDSYKCFPPAEITGQVQPVIPDVFKYTPNSSPTNNGMQSDAGLDTFYSKLRGGQHELGGSASSSTSGQSSHWFSKAAANVDHDYGFTCRTPKTPTIFSADSLGIQTPSASEPPTDSDDDELNLDDIPLNFESSDMDREQQEYFENLKRQMQLAELSQTYRDKERRPATNGGASNASTTTAGGGSRSVSKERKSGGKNRKRKYASASKERLAVAAPDKHLPAKTKITWRVADSKYEATTAFTTGSGKVRVRLPANHQDAAATTTTTSPAAATASTTISSAVAAAAAAKRKKNGNGGRVFTMIERHQHNTNEQVRRIEMRQSFEELRQLVPSLLDKPKAPKVSILQEAKMYCDELFHQDLKLQNQVTALKCQQDRMRQSLSQLRRYAAATRH